MRSHGRARFDSKTHRLSEQSAPESKEIGACSLIGRELRRCTDQRCQGRLAEPKLGALGPYDAQQRQSSLKPTAKMRTEKKNKTIE